MAKPSFTVLWNRIIACQRETFHTKRGLEFTYDINGNTFYSSRTEYAIPKSNFEKVYPMVPIIGPGKINDIVRGPSYIWAVLHDKRISKGNW